jgi:branched-chain amino acid transport system ATP-binding protein
VTRPRLEVRDLEVAYGRVRALAGGTLAVHPGELVTIVGPNGAGKTTLMRAVMGQVPARRGTVLLDGQPLTGLATEAIVRRGVALVPEGRDLFGSLTVRENLLLGAYPLDGAERRARLGERLDRVLALFPALAPRLRQLAATLSGGEQQMVALGRTLMAAPRLLLLDEPSVGLAPLVVREIFRALRTLKAEHLTILLVEQNARAAFRIADRGYALSPGRPLVPVDAGGQLPDSARRAYGLEVRPQEASP